MRLINSVATATNTPSDCKKCELHCTRKNLIYGTGNPNSRILIVKDMPTSEENRVGTHDTPDLDLLVRVFYEIVVKEEKLCGRVNQDEARQVLLDSCFITDSVACRSEIQSGENAGEGRDPKQSQIKACRDRLQETVYEIDPLITLACGKFAVTSLLKRNKDLPAKTGKADSLFTYTVPGRMVEEVRYSGIYTYDWKHAERIGDYDDPSGAIASFCNAMRTVWRIHNKLIGERDD